MIGQHNSFETREKLADALAARVAHELAQLIAEKDMAVLAVSGGTTPALFLAALSTQPIDWGKVVVTLVDERQVPESNARSNAALVRRLLLAEKAARARFVPLFQNEAEAQELPLDVVVLGMGADGHTASFFPGGDTLAEAINPHTEKKLVAISAPGSGEPRLTFTLSALLAASTLCLHIEGEEKMAVLRQAIAGSDALQMPIRAVLASPRPLDLYWCP